MRSRLVLAALSFALIGCGNRHLDLALALASNTCTVPVPAGGSILFQLAIEDPSDAGAGTSSFCGGCLTVTDALPDTNAIVAFLRAKAPACADVKPNSQIQIALTAFKVAACMDGQPSTRVFCAQSQMLPIPDGHADAVVAAALSCDPTCGANVTPPTDMGQCVTGCVASACAPCCTDTYTGSNDSNQTCPSGCTCGESCSGANSCHFTCSANATCTASADNTDTGVMDCSPGSTCQLKCTNIGDHCTLNCNNASCLIDCGSSSCNLSNCSGAVTSCPNNVKVCGRPCP
jgi:hypothetical protein